MYIKKTFFLQVYSENVEEVKEEPLGSPPTGSTLVLVRVVDPDLQLMRI